MGSERIYGYSSKANSSKSYISEHILYIGPPGIKCQVNWGEVLHTVIMKDCQMPISIHIHKRTIFIPNLGV